MTPNLLSPTQAARFAGVSRVAIWKARQRGEIRAAAEIPGRGALYSRQEITEWKALRKRRQHEGTSILPNLDVGLRKGYVYASLNGISQTFALWHRKATVHKWGEPEIQKALDLLSPIMKFWCELEERDRPFREKRKKAREQGRKRREAAHLSAVSD
jgi:hypothetical protein